MSSGQPDYSETCENDSDGSSDKELVDHEGADVFEHAQPSESTAIITELARQLGLPEDELKANSSFLTCLSELESELALPASFAVELGAVAHHATLPVDVDETRAEA
eukprot:3590086-Pyramimonas_sp.AAC.1